jgi:ABC-2 type transport system ATP-binding protein
MRDIEEVCDRVLFLHSGKILASGTSDEIKQRFAGKDLDDVFVKIARKQVDTLQI